MVGVVKIFTDIVTIKDRQLFWCKLMSLSLEDTPTNTGPQVRKINSNLYPNYFCEGYFMRFFNIR